METKFKSKEAIKAGWEAMKKNFWFFVVLLLIIWASQIIPTGIANSFKGKIVVLYIMFTLVAWIVQLIVKSN